MSETRGGTARSDETQILQANSDQNQAMIDADTEALDSLLAPGFELVHITGYAQPKEEWLAEIRTGGMAYHEIRPQFVSVKIDGDRALLIARNLVTATIWGTNATWPLEMTTTFERVGILWLLTHSRARTY